MDNGVIEHLIPYMKDQSGGTCSSATSSALTTSDIRVGPERETMRLKLEQMDGVLRQVVDMLDDQTLLVVLGDHGMDAKGNHGGDAELETASALWMYSKGTVLAAKADTPDVSLRGTPILGGGKPEARQSDRPRTNLGPSAWHPGPVQQPRVCHSRMLCGQPRGGYECERGADPPV